MIDDTYGENPNENGELRGEQGGTTRRNVMKGIGAAGAATVAGGTAFSSGAAAYTPSDGVPFGSDLTKVAKPSMYGYASTKYATSDSWRPILPLLLSQDPLPPVSETDATTAVNNQKTNVVEAMKTVHAAVVDAAHGYSGRVNSKLGDTNNLFETTFRTIVSDAVAQSHIDGQSETQAAVNARNAVEEYALGIEKRFINLWNAAAFVQWYHIHRALMLVLATDSVTQSQFFDVTSGTTVFDMENFDSETTVEEMMPIGEYTLSNGDTVDVAPIMSISSSDSKPVVCSPYDDDVDVMNFRPTERNVVWNFQDKTYDMDESTNIFELQADLLTNPSSNHNDVGVNDPLLVTETGTVSASEIKLGNHAQSVEEIMESRLLYGRIMGDLSNLTNFGSQVTTYYDNFAGSYDPSTLTFDREYDGSVPVTALEAVDHVTSGADWNAESLDVTVHRDDGDGNTTTQNIVGNVSVRIDSAVSKASIDQDETPFLPPNNDMLNHIRDNIESEETVDVTVYINYDDGAGNSMKEAKYQTTSTVDPSTTYGLGLGLTNNIVSAPDGVTDLVSDVSLINFAHIRIDNVTGGVSLSRRLTPDTRLLVDPDFEFGDAMGADPDIVARHVDITAVENGSVESINVYNGGEVTINQINNVAGDGTLNYIDVPIWIGSSDNVSQDVVYRSNTGTENINTVVDSVMSFYTDNAPLGSMSSINGTYDAGGGLLGGALGGSGGSGGSGGDVGSGVDKVIGVLTGSGLLAAAVYAVVNMDLTEDASDHR